MLFYIEVLLIARVNDWKEHMFNSALWNSQLDEKTFNQA